MLIPLCVSVAVLPAWSSQVPVADWFKPSVEIVSSTVDVTTPEPLSLHDHVTVTSLLFQPFPFAAGLLLKNVMRGSVVSTIEEVADALAEAPPSSVYGSLPSEIEPVRRERTADCAQRRGERMVAILGVHD